MRILLSRTSGKGTPKREKVHLTLGPDVKDVEGEEAEGRSCSIGVGFRVWGGAFNHRGTGAESIENCLLALEVLDLNTDED